MRHYLYTIKGWPVVETIPRDDDPRRTLVGIYDDDLEMVRRLAELMEQARAQTIAEQRAQRRPGPIGLTPCGRCLRRIDEFELSGCWRCKGPLCVECWDRFGVCGCRSPEQVATDRPQAVAEKERGVVIMWPGPDRPATQSPAISGDRPATTGDHQIARVARKGRRGRQRRPADAS